MNLSQPPRQLRLIIETDDFDSALHFYRDVLGLTEQPAFATDGEDRVAILNVAAATIELATRTHIHNIDAIENAPSVEGPTARIALEVDNTEVAMTSAEEFGLKVLAPATRTPFETINGRVQGPSGWQLTFFQELETLQERTKRKGFTTDVHRSR
ncbi:VOC family protein [Paenarthrobacter sp. CCNWLY172]|uniref:VOC family protein n=1 Tax=unclassified Paenarthrobacter TaxID=2634190 RepID=UPI003076A5D1